MALLDFLKKKEEAEKSKKSAKKAEKVSVAKPSSSAKATADKESKKAESVKTKTETSVKSAKVKTSKFSYEAIKEPHISEKASYLSEKNQYTFEIAPNYNKNEIKKSIEGIYKVDVLSVNIIKIPQKKRRLGKTQGFRKAYKKAVVKIKDGQKIEIL